MNDCGDKARIAWELARSASGQSEDVIATTSQPATLDGIWQQQTGPRADSVVTYQMLGRRICPSHIIAHTARNGSERNALRAAQHPACPAELAIETTARHIRAAVEQHGRHGSIAFLPAAALDQLAHAAATLDIRRRSQLADDIAIATHGTISRDTTIGVRRWLQTRRTAHLPARTSTLTVAYARGDNTAEQAAELLGAMLRRPGWAEHLSYTLDMTPPPPDAALTVAQQTGSTSSDQAGWLLSLLTHCPGTMLPQQSLATSENDGTDGGETVADLLARRQAAPAALTLLDSGELDLFATAAATWTGTLTELLDTLHSAAGPGSTPAAVGRQPER